MITLYCHQIKTPIKPKAMTQQKITLFFCHPFFRQVLITLLLLYAIDYCLPLFYVLLIICLMGSWWKAGENISH